MKKLLSILVLGLLWCSTSYSNIIMQDLIDALVETKKPKSIEVANNLKSTGNNDKSYDLVIRKANLNIEDAKNIALRAVKAAITRNIGTGDGINVALIDKNGFRLLVKEQKKSILTL